MLGRNSPEMLQVSSLRNIKPGIARNRLQNNSGDLPKVGRESGSDTFDIIERQNDGVLSEGSRHSGAIWMTEGKRARPGFYQQRIHMAMVTTVELDNLVAFGEPASQANRRHAGLRA